MSLNTLIARPALRKAAIALVIFLVLFGLLGVFAAPHLVRSLAEKHGSAFLGRTLSIDEVNINPYTLKLDVRGFRMLEVDGKEEAASVDRLTVDVEWMSLFRGAPVIRQVEVERPLLRIVRLDEDGHYNYSDVLKKLLDQPPSDEPARFSVNNITLRDGRIDIDDQPFARKHVISDIQIGLPFVSNLPSDVELFVEPSIAARINDAPFSLKGRIRPFLDEREATLKIEFNALNLARFDEYSPVPLGFRIASGALDTDIDVSFRQPASGDTKIALQGTLELRDLELDNREGQPLLRLPALDMVLNEIQPLEGKVDIASIRIDQPDIELARLKDGSWNLMALGPLPAQQRGAADAGGREAGEDAARAAGKKEEKDGPKPEPKKAVPDVKLGMLEILQARLAFTDDVPAQTFKYVIEPMDVVLRDFALNADTPAKLLVSATTESNARISLDARVKIAQPGIEGELTVADLDLPRFSPYFADRINFDLEEAAFRLGTRFGLRIENGTPQGEIAVTEAGISRLRLARPRERGAFMQADDIVVRDARVDLSSRKVSIESFVIERPRAKVARLADGSMDLAALMRAPAGISQPATVASGKDAAAWSARLGSVLLNDGSLHFEDRTLTTPAVIDLSKLAFKLDNVGTDPKLRSVLELSFRDPKGGVFGTRGSFTQSPLKADLKVDVRRLDLLAAQPWMARKLNAELLAGSLSLRGDLGVQMQTSGRWTLGWSGEGNVDNIHLTDKLNAADLLKWRSLFAGGMQLRLDSARPDLLAGLSINEIALSDYFARVIVSPEGRLNLQDIVRAEDGGSGTAATPVTKAPVAKLPAAKAPSAPAGAGKSAPARPAEGQAALAKVIDTVRPPIDIKTVVMQGGRVDFSDFFIKPNYRAQLSELGGRVAGLSSVAGTRGEVELRGVVEGSAPIDITGRINPLAQSLFLDIKASARGIELAPLSPYSGKYVGYGIEKGKLSVNIAYKIENDQLTAQNNVILDQLTFGAAVDSPDAIKAPVLLAVSLLKDRNGVIDINLPISGSLSDPQFSIGGIVVKVIVNLIVKAVTSPFALLGSLFGSEAELDHVAFDPGRSTLSDTARGKLDTLAKALNDRPALKLEVSGRVDRAVDVEGYRRAVLDRRIRAAKAAQTKGSADEVTVSADEYPRLLEVVYKASSFPKPRNVIGLAKDLPVPEMEKLILTNTEVSDEDLRQLGLARAQVVKDYLSRSGKVEDGRLFVLSPRLDAAGDAAKEGRAKDDRSAPARAEFTIRN